MDTIKGIPSRTKIRFFHENQRLAPLEVRPQELAADSPWCQGPAKVSEWIFGDPPQHIDLLSKYGKRSVATIYHPNETLRINAQMAHAYIKACSDPEVFAVDPEQSAHIGGHIHIATITPKEGFQWVPRFQPAVG